MTDTVRQVSEAIAVALNILPQDAGIFETHAKAAIAKHIEIIRERIELDAGTPPSIWLSDLDAHKREALGDE